MGVLLKPLSAMGGWSRAEISTGPLLCSFAMILLGPMVGALCDRWGVRKVGLAGALLCGGLMTAAPLALSALWAWYLFWLAYALAQLLITPIVWARAITPIFDISRGLALGIGLAGAGVAAALYPGFTYILLNHFGLRGVYPALGLSIALVLAPFVLLALRDSRTGAVSKSPEVTSGVPFGEVVRTALFWRIVAAFALIALVISGTNLHLQAMLSDRGAAPSTAVCIASAIGLSALCGRLFGGWLLDHFSSRVLAATFFALAAVGCSIFSFNQPTLYIAAAILIGFSAGVEGDLLAFILSKTFGVRHFGAIYGLSMAAFACGYAVGPIAAGWSYDALGSYESALRVASGSLVLAACLAASFSRHPKFTDQDLTASRAE
jgi:MFS transporter, OFA family, oxalate/formate antiporter